MEKQASVSPPKVNNSKIRELSDSQTTIFLNGKHNQ
jgi:hypothetical protein